MASKKKQLLFVAPYFTSFISKDIDILESKYKVVKNVLNWRNKKFAPILLLYQTLILLIKLWQVKVVVVEFGGYWSLMPSLLGKIFHKPVYIVLHGTDTASLPDINYGSLRKKALKLSCYLSYKYCKCLLPVSESLIFTDNFYNEKFRFQGVNYFFPRLKTPYTVISNGLDSSFWKPDFNVHKDNNRFIAVFSDSQFLLKGGDLIIHLAKKFPDFEFYIAGMNRPESLDTNVKNIIFLGKLPKVQLREQYQKSKFHLQLSMFEGFGLSLCEAMLCECIPIGSSVNVIPDIIGDSGYIVGQKKDYVLYDTFESAIKNSSKDEKGKMARERIVKNFNIEQRKKLLLDAIEPD